MPPEPFEQIFNAYGAIMIFFMVMPFPTGLILNEIQTERLLMRMPRKANPAATKLPAHRERIALALHGGGALSAYWEQVSSGAPLTASIESNVVRFGLNPWFDEPDSHVEMRIFDMAGRELD